MAKANFGLTAVAAMGAVTAFGVVPANADIWLHQGTNNTSFATSEMMTGNVTGVRVNIGAGDNLWAFTALTTSQFINISSGPSNQPGVLYVLDKDGKPFEFGSGFNDLNGMGINMVLDIGSQNVGQQATFVFGNFGVLAQNSSTVLFSSAQDGQINPDAIMAWTLTGGENQFSSEVREYQINGITGVPAPGVLTLAMAGGLLAARRRR